MSVSCTLNLLTYNLGKVTFYDNDIDEVFEKAHIDTSELLTKINTIPKALESKNIDVGNYNKKYERFFEEFYIVGVDKNVLDTLNNQDNIVRPTLLFHYPNRKEHHERHNIIKDF